MKSLYINRKVCVFILFLILFSLTSIQGQENSSSQLTGAWVLDAESSFLSIDSHTKEFMRANPQFLRQIQAAYIGKTITFSANASYLQVLGNNQKSTGKWLVENNYLQMTSSNGEVISYSIALQNNILFLGLGSQDTNMKSIVPNQYFNKL